MLLLILHGLILRILQSFGGFGLVCLGSTDGTMLPLPGSTDALTVFLAARHHESWFYYGLMASIGSCLGGCATYHFGAKRGAMIIAARLGADRADKLFRFFQRWGFSAVAVPAMLPIPMPVAPFFVTAGAMRYPKWRFMAALACGRAIKFNLLALLASLYGRRAVLQAAGQYRWAVVAVIAVLVFVAAGFRTLALNQEFTADMPHNHTTPSSES